MPEQDEGKPRKGIDIEGLCTLTKYWRYWKLRHKIRHWARYVVGGTLFVTAAGFLYNFFWHVVAEHLAGPLTAEVPSGIESVLHSLVLRSFVIGFLFYLSLNHFKEARKVGYEYDFVRSFCDFQVKLRINPHMTPAEALGYFYPAFERAEIDFLAVFFPQDGKLTVNGWFPSDRDPGQDYFPTLGVREGVGGLVANDSISRYMPWCSTPESWWQLKNWEPQRPWPFRKRGRRWKFQWRWPVRLKRKPFRHALRFDFSKGSDVIVDDVDPNVLKLPHHFESLLCVPFTNAGKSPGFLQMTFTKTKSLDVSDITMAVVIGLLLGEALNLRKEEVKA